MANLMRELERFEQEMKELGSKTSLKFLPPSPPSPPPSPPLPCVVLRGHLPPPPPPSPPTCGLIANNTITKPFLVPPPPSLHMPTIIASPQPRSCGPWVSDSKSSTSSVVITSQSTLPTLPPLPPPITFAPQYPYSVSSITTSYTLSPPLPPPPTNKSYFPIPFHLQQEQYQVTPQHYNPTSQTIYKDQCQTHLPTSQSSIRTTHYQYLTLYQQPASSMTTRLKPTIYRAPQAQQLFRRDAQTITPEALENVKAALASGEGEQTVVTKKKAIPRKAAGQTWDDPTLAEWPENDHRLFCGDLGNEVNDEVLTKAFSRFTTFNMARVVRDKRTGKTKGYGFVSFTNPSDLALAFKEMNGKYVGNRPIKLRKSKWKERIDTKALQNLKYIKGQKTSKKNILHK